MSKQDLKTPNAAKLSLYIFFICLLFTACQKNTVTSSEPTWTLSQQNYLPAGFLPQVGDEVLARVFDEAGNELVSESVIISADNQNSWQSDLAQQLNTTTNYVSVQKDPTKTSSLVSNYVWLASENHTFNLGLKY